MNKITYIKALRDNYIWLIHGVDPSHVIVIDPGEATPVIAHLKENNLHMDGILLTHHHWDHTNGVNGLLQQYPHTPIYSSESDKVDGVTHFVKEGENIHFANLPSPIKVLDIPGHTLGHVAFIYEDALFSGDTLFSCGCGRIFEGTPEQMFDSLQKLKQLPADTLMYCAHEYTESNIAFAEVAEVDNKALQLRKKQVADLRKANLPTLPISLKTELETNPFLRCKSAADLLHLREWKSKFDAGVK
ncbi:MAG TPA: hydroxyacylglutathione hydrolase [Gammaproteobacteria bacterium]|nr:hydroxyacylglutathione hydrolase [Gammaproteobacteria bacterium]